MAGQGRTLMILAGVLVAGIGAAVWLAMSSDGDAPGDAGKSAAAVTLADAAPKAPTPAAPRAKKVGTAAVFGEIRRSAAKTPVADQLVTLSPERGEPWTATTDAQGAFRFDKIPHGGPYELSAAAKGCATVRIPGMALDRNEQRNVGTLFLDPSVKLTVRVRSSTDQPVEGALVEAFAIPQVVDWDWTKALAQLGQAPVSVAKTSTDAAGDAAFPEMAVGNWTFTARKDGFAKSGVKRVTLRSDQEPRPVTIYLTPGHPLDGRVLGPDKVPVAGALVMATAPNSQWDLASAALRARTTSDAEGHYEFAALESGETQLSVARAGGIPAPVVTVRVPLVPHLDISLKGEGVVAGVVTEKETSKPSEGATVRATSWEDGSNRTAEAMTDADGKYSIRMPAGALNRLNAEKAGFLQVRDEAPATGMQRVAMLHEGETLSKDLVLRQGAKLSGTVKGPDGPLAGARVSVGVGGRPNEGPTQKSATTDADGHYEFAAVEKGVVLVTATKEGHYLPDAPENWWQAMQSPDLAKELKVDMPETGAATKDLVMKRGSGVDGTVQGPDGAPLAGVRVTGASAVDGAVSAADGAFHLVGVKPGAAVRLWGSKDGYANATNKPFAVVADQPTTGVLLKMNREARVHGTVTTASGAAATEVRVLLGYRSASSQDNPWEEQSRWQNATRVVVKPDGTFDGPVSGTPGPNAKLIVRAVSLDQQQTDAKPVDLVEGQDVYEVTIVLTDGVDLVGTVVAKGGTTGVAGARVSIAPKRVSDNNMYGSTGQFPVWAVTDSAGAFSVRHLAAGQFDVRAEAAGFVVGRAAVNLAEGKPVVVEMSPELTIEGVVALADGAPVEGVQVQVAGAQQNRSFGSMSETQPVATSDARGAFRLTGFGEGTYSLDVRPPWGSELNVRPVRVDGIAGGAKGVKVVVAGGGVIAGRVADTQGRPVTSAWVSANPLPKPGATMDGSEWRNAQTKQDGTFLLTGLGEGPYALQIGSNGRGTGYRPAKVDSVAVGTKDVAVVMEEGLSISGAVVDADGRPIVQMAVQATQVTGPGPGGNSYTDSEGKFTVSGLSQGTYRIEVAQWGGSNQGYVIDAPQPYAAGTTGLRLVASKGVTISGVVVDESGAAVVGASVSAASSKGGNKWSQSKGDGTFELVGLETGQTYRLDVQMQGRVNASVEGVVAGAKDVRMVLAKGLEASGKLTDAAGKAMPTASVWFTRGDGKNQWTQTDAAGRFTAGGLLDGGSYDAKVYVQSGDGKGGEWKAVGTIKAGDRDADLRMP